MHAQNHNCYHLIWQVHYRMLSWGHWLTDSRSSTAHTYDRFKREHKDTAHKQKKNWKWPIVYLCLFLYLEHSFVRLCSVSVSSIPLCYNAIYLAQLSPSGRSTRLGQVVQCPGQHYWDGAVNEVGFENMAAKIQSDQLSWQLGYHDILSKERNMTGGAWLIYSRR